jgi:hypothetical protein
MAGGAGGVAAQALVVTPEALIFESSKVPGRHCERSKVIHLFVGFVKERWIASSLRASQ